MEAKAPTSTFFSHSETRLSPDPTAATVYLQLPSAGPFSRSSSRAQRRVLDNDGVDYKGNRIASSASIYFRSRNRYPRSILWRCIEQDRVLELRSVDLTKAEGETREARIVLNIAFPAEIRPYGVAVADAAEEDIISVFAITTNNDLYTLSLKPNFFSKLTASEEDSDHWCKLFRPSSLSISGFFRLTANTSSEVLITLTDGRLVRLTKKQGEDGSQWNEAAYNDGQWKSSLRGLIRWQGNNTVRYQGNALDQGTVLNAVVSPDNAHIVAVGLNHTLKFWNIETGRSTVSKDLLDLRKEPHDASKFMLNPGTSKVLGVIEVQSGYDGDLYYAITLSPHNSGMFKIWGVRDADIVESGVRDVFPDDNLRVPDPDDGAPWSVADFHLKSNSATTGVDIWILVRLNRRYKLYHRQFSELRMVGLEWQHGWSVIGVNHSRHEPSNAAPLKISDLDAQGISDKWLDYVTTPGRVPESVLETALQRYSDSQGTSRNDKAPLRARIATTIGLQLRLESYASDAISNFHENSQKEWARFWDAIVEVENTRWDPLVLVFDDYDDMPYIVCSEGLSVVRELCELETVAYNSAKDLSRIKTLSLTGSIEMEGDSITTTAIEELSAIISAASRFRAEFSENLVVSCEDTLKSELWLDSSFSAPERVHAFYDRCNFESEVGDRAYNHLVGHLRSIGGFNALSTDALLSIIELLPRDMSQASSGLKSSLFGLKALVKGAQDMIALQLRVLKDLLYLLVFADVEVDRDEFSMENLDTSRVFTDLLQQLRQTELAYWLTTHTRTMEDKRGQSKGLYKPQSTILENLFAVDIKPQSSTTQSQRSAFTQTVRDLLTWTSGANQITLDKVLVNIQCDFLKRQNIDLASAFDLFQPSTAWATYIRGRLNLEKANYAEAALLFRKAALKLSRSPPSPSEYTLSSSSLLDPITAAYLSTGLPNYYTHIINLFSSHRAHSQIVLFARLAIQSLPQRPNDPTPTENDQRSDLISRLFHASLAINDFATAFSALTRHTNPVLRKTALSTLVATMVAQHAVAELLALPFPGSLQKEVDSILLEHSSTSQDSGSSDKISYFKILHAFRLQRGDYRGAAAVLVERLEARHERREHFKSINTRFASGAHEAERALDEYLVGINALALLQDEDADDGGDEDAWVLVERSKGVDQGEEGRAVKKRRVMRLDGLRERYQAEMDKIGVLEMGRWGIVGDEGPDGMDGIET